MYLNDEHDGEYSFDTYVDYDDEISTERLKKSSKVTSLWQSSKSK